MEDDISTSEDPFAPRIAEEWIEMQDSLKKQLIAVDRFSWKLPFTEEHDFGRNESCQDTSCGERLKYIGGVDLSFSKNDPSIACATLVVLDSSTFDVVHEDSAIVELRVPYVPGFLAFREAPVIFELLKKMKKKGSTYYPQVLMVDGNGILHPRGFGLACHVGVLADLPTIGIGKNLHHVDGLTQSKVKQLIANSSTDILSLVGDSGADLGAAMRSSDGSIKPVFVSVGHCISLDSAIKIVKFCCRYRVPEPVRQVMKMVGVISPLCFRLISDQKSVFGIMVYDGNFRQRLWPLGEKNQA